MYSFYDDSFVNKSMNAPFSTSIPKKLGASNIKDYKPIILIGSAYKSIDKLLTYWSWSWVYDHKSELRYSFDGALGFLDEMEVDWILHSAVIFFILKWESLRFLW